MGAIGDIEPTEPVCIAVNRIASFIALRTSLNPFRQLTS
jgi:hypothetical protein